MREHQPPQKLGSSKDEKPRETPSNIPEQLLNETTYQTILDRSAAGITVTDSRERIIYWNKFAENLLGMDRADLYLKQVESLYPKEEWRKIRSYDVRRKGMQDHLETKIIKKNGGIIDVDISITVLKDEKGGITGAIGIIRDITERKRAETALRQSEEKFRMVFENSAVAITVGDDQERIVSWNEFTEKLLGYTKKDLYQRPISSLYPEEEWRRIRSLNIRQQGFRAHLEAKMYKKDRTLIDVDMSLSVLKDALGRVIGSIGITRDVTARKQAQDALRESERRYAHLIEMAPDPIIMLDRTGNIESLNPAAENILGYAKVDLIGKHFLKVGVVTHASVPKAVSEFSYVMKGESRPPFELTIVRKDQSNLTLEANPCPIFKEDKVVGVQLICRDITQRKKIEHELHNAKEAAEYMAEVKSTFLANMSHEIRTPMNGIMGMIELLLDTSVSDEQKEYLATAKSSADSLLTLLNDILDLSKIEAGRLELDEAEFNLRDTLDDTLNALAHRAHSKSLELICHIPPGVPELVAGDPGRLRQIIVNLVGNAVKFTETGEIVVSAELESQNAKRVCLHFTVRDTGIGVPREKCQSIFSPFTQAHTNTKHKYGGTGLGLSISAQLCELMGGRIWAEPAGNPDAVLEKKGGPGSVFHFIVCFGRAAESSAPSLSKAVKLANMRTLIIDDNVTTRRILHETLESWGLAPSGAPNVMMALSLLRTASADHNPYPVVLLDANMPSNSSFQFVEEIRQDPELKTTKVIMLTAAGMRGDAARCRNLGVEAYLTKPIRQSQLLNALHHVMDQSSPDGSGNELLTRHSLREGRSNLDILLAEDNPVNQMVAMRLLEKRGHRVIVAKDGKEALEILDREKVDLVLMDIQMPEMDGFEATAAIRQREKETGYHLPIVAMTAHAIKGDRERCIAAGMDDYLSKPVRPEELYETIRKWTAATSEPETKKAATAEASDPTVDFVKGLAFVGGDDEVYRSILQIYLEDIPVRLEEIRQAITRHEAALLERASHSVKGASANIGAGKMQKEAWYLEMCAKEGRWEGVDQLFTSLAEEFEKVKQFLEKNS